MADLTLEDGVTIREIALWALLKHRDALGDHLDLSNEELQRVGEELLDVHDDDREEVTDG